MKPGATTAQAEADLNSVAGDLARLYPAENADTKIQLTTEADGRYGDATGVLKYGGFLALCVSGLVLLAAANRDPAANPDPARFDPARADRRSFTFGHGAHACPGRTLALVIAASAVRALLARGLDPATLVRPARYRRSANARIPLLATRDACP